MSQICSRHFNFPCTCGLRFILDKCLTGPLWLCFHGLLASQLWNKISAACNDEALLNRWHVALRACATMQCFVLLAPRLHLCLSCQVRILTFGCFELWGWCGQITPFVFHLTVVSWSRGFVYVHLPLRCQLCHASFNRPEFNLAAMSAT